MHCWVLLKRQDNLLSRSYQNIFCSQLKLIPVKFMNVYSVCINKTIYVTASPPLPLPLIFLVNAKLQILNFWMPNYLK